MLDVKNVSYCIDDQRILDRVSFRVDQGEAIAVVGPSGSGKSTLLRIVADLISPTEGTIRFKNEPYETYEPEALRQRISYLPQSVELFGDTIRDNLIFPSHARKEGFDKSRAKFLLDAMGLKKYKLSDSVHHMSGGEKQRVTIARQLMFKPDLLLLDEATSALDDINSKKIEKFIFDLVKEGMSVMWITHNTEQSHRHFHRQLEITNGTITKEEQ